MMEKNTTRNTKPNTKKLADPCIKLCVKDSEEDVCLGCGRTQGEIKDWAQLSSAQKKIILHQTDQRLNALTQKRREKRKERQRAKAALKNA